MIWKLLWLFLLLIDICSCFIVHLVIDWWKFNFNIFRVHSWLFIHYVRNLKSHSEIDIIQFQYIIVWYLVTLRICHYLIVSLWDELGHLITGVYKSQWKNQKRYDTSWQCWDVSLSFDVKRWNFFCEEVHPMKYILDVPQWPLAVVTRKLFVW